MVKSSGIILLVASITPALAQQNATRPTWEVHHPPKYHEGTTPDEKPPSAARLARSSRFCGVF